MTFEWDALKSASNKLKHGLSFEEVEDAIEKSGIVAMIDNPSYPGQRIIVFRTAGKEIARAIIEFRGTKARIISAQRSRKLRKLYGP